MQGLLPRGLAAVGLLASFTLSHAIDPLNLWQQRNPFPDQRDLNALTYGDGKYVAVGAQGAVLVSKNGTNWQSLTLATNMTLWGVAFGNGLFVATGQTSSYPTASNVVVVSTNGVDWIDRRIGNGKPIFTDVAWGNGRFVAVGDRALATSEDGVKWTDRTASATNWWDTDSVTWGAGRFVVVGYTSYTSTNGVDWESPPEPVFQCNSGAKVRFGNGRFVAVLADDSFPGFATSTNGIEWSNSGGSGGGSVLHAVGYSDGQFVAVGSWADEWGDYWRVTAWISTNGQDWSERRAAGLLVTANDVWGEPGRLLAVGPHGTIAVSRASSDWTMNWTTVHGPLGMKSVTYGKGRFVGVGPGGAINVSRDGIAWFRQAAPVSYDWQDVTYGNDRFVAVGLFGSHGDGPIMTSTDGTNWVIPFLSDYDLYGVTHAGGKFVALGGYEDHVDAGAHVVLTSDDGLVWTTRESGSCGPLTSCAYGHGVSTAIAHEGVVVASANGVDWVRQVGLSASLLSVAFGNGTFVAVGDPDHWHPRVFSSTTGTAWSEVWSSTNRCILSRVFFADNTFVAVSAGWRENGLIFTSADGKAWQQRPSPTALELTGITYGEGTFVAVGPSGVILQTPDVRPRLQFERWGSDDGARCLFLLDGLSNALYRVEYSTDLIHWVPGWTHRVYGQPVKIFDGSADSPPQRFFRAQFVPD